MKEVVNVEITQKPLSRPLSELGPDYVGDGS
jgi:hypothetical protein